MPDEDKTLIALQFWSLKNNDVMCKPRIASRPIKTLWQLVILMLTVKYLLHSLHRSLPILTKITPFTCMSFIAYFFCLLACHCTTFWQTGALCTNQKYQCKIHVEINIWKSFQLVFNNLVILLFYRKRLKDWKDLANLPQWQILTKSKLEHRGQS